MSAKRYRRIGWALALACLPFMVAAETAEERLQRLEREIEELRQMLHRQQDARPASAEPVAAAPAPIQHASVRTGAFIRYFIRNQHLGERPPAEVAPTAEGRISETHTLSFDPSAYDVPSAGLFSDYRDPASYRYVGLALEGELPVRTAGEYEFVLSPKPAREGGANVSTRMSVWLRVDDRAVIELQDQSSWRVQRGRIRLEPGVHRLQIWSVSASEGFGPSPTASQLLVALKAPGDASPRPLHDLRPGK